MTTLYFAPHACSLAVHIVLEWIGKPYDAVKVNQHDPVFRRINPAGAVPALVIGGEVKQTQCSAILFYLASTHPAADLLDERSPEHAAELHKWAAFLTGDMHPAFFGVFMPGRYTSSKDPQALADVKQASTGLVKTKLALLEAQIRGRSWIVSDKRTIIDAYATPMLDWAASLLRQDFDQYPACKLHHERMMADPGVQRAIKSEAA